MAIVAPPRKGAVSIAARHRICPEIRLAFLRIELPPHRRVNAVGADEDIGFVFGDSGAVAIDEGCDHLVAALDKFLEHMTGVQRIADPRARRLDHHHLQPAAMDRVLRPRETGGAAALLAPHRLAKFVEEGQRLGRDADLGKTRAEAKLGQLAHGIGLDIDADTERRHLARGLIDVRLNADLMQAHRQGETADPAADDDHLHR
jgi:hypothetical protein